MTIEEQLQELRQRWLEAKRQGNTSRMKIIEMRGKLLKMQAPPIPKRVDRLREVMDIFGVK